MSNLDSLRPLKEEDEATERAWGSEAWTSALTGRLYKEAPRADSPGGENRQRKETVQGC